MKNTAVNTLRYTGIVTLSQYIGSKKIKIAQLHNEGGNSLFNFFAHCLAGDFTMARAYRPTKVMLVKRIGDDSNARYENTKETLGFLHMLTTPEIVDDATTRSRVRYSFLIQKEVVNNLTDFDDLYLGLYADEADKDKPEDYAALCKLDLTKNQLANASLLVDWELIISNISTDE